MVFVTYHYHYHYYFYFYACDTAFLKASPSLKRQPGEAAAVVFAIPPRRGRSSADYYSRASIYGGFLGLPNQLTAYH